MKKSFQRLFVVMIATALLFTTLPAASVSAKTKHKGDDGNSWWDWFNEWDNWWYDSDDEKDTEYLVLIGQSSGSYVAYDDIAFLTGGKHVMVKAKPLATALGLTYKSSTGKKDKKGMSLSLGTDTNVYQRNSKTYYFYDYDINSKQTITHKYSAQYKQIVYGKYNAIHSATLSTLVNYQYYSTDVNSTYQKLGYRGVLVYNKYSAINKLPDITNVSNYDGYVPDNNNNNNNNNNNSAINVTVKPVIVTDSVYTDIKNVEATYSITQASTNQNLDLSEVLSTFQTYKLPNTGIYGSGNCDTVVTVKAYDKNGYLVGEIKTTGNEFLMNFPTATKLVVAGNAKNLMLDFTPVLPIMLLDYARIPFTQMSWVYASDGYARQYFVLGDYMKLYPENVTSSYAISRKFLSAGNYTNPDSAASYQRITAVLKSPYSELTSPNCYINVQKTNKGINNSLVIFNDSGSVTLSSDYETKLNSMITTLSKTGQSTYFSSKNWNRQLVMKLSDQTINTTYSYIAVDPSYLNLDHFLDYYFTLHEMVHFYEASQLHYGFRFEAWTEGNAIHLARKTLDALAVSHKDSNGVDYINSMYTTDYKFLTQNDKNNFEAYYLGATGWNATVIGYHFTEFLQDMYGSDVIYRIMEKISAAKIPTNAGRSSTYDKQFTDCIKSVTSQNVFQLFVEYSIN